MTHMLPATRDAGLTDPALTPLAAECADGRGQRGRIDRTAAVSHPRPAGQGRRPPPRAAR